MKQTKTLMLTIMIPVQPDLPEHVQQWMRHNLTSHIEQEFGVEWDPEWVTPTYEGPPATGPVTILSKLVDTVVHKVPRQ